MLWSLALPFLAAASLADAQGAEPPTQPLLISSISIVSPQDATVGPPRDILIADGKIVKIAEAGSIDRSMASSIIEGLHLYALPGLIDVHAHIGDGGAGQQTIDDRERALHQFLRYGVTTIFVPGGSGGNDDDLARWRWRCTRGELVCPGLYGSGSLITASGSHPITTIFGLSPDADPATTEAVGITAVRPGDDIRSLVSSKVASGADAIKIVIEDGPPPWFPKPRLSDAQIKALVAAAHEEGVPIYAHVGRADHVAAGLAGGIDGIMHSPLDLVPDAMLQDMARDEVFYIATMALYDGIRDWASRHEENDAFALGGITPRSVATLADPSFLATAPETLGEAAAYVAVAGDNLRRASAAGVPLALGTDTNNPFVYPGYSVHEELSLMVDAGLTPAQALHAATVGGSAFLKRTGSLGQIAEGYEADILILRGNPLVDVLNTRTLTHVISDGRVVVDVVAHGNLPLGGVTHDRDRAELAEPTS